MLFFYKSEVYFEIYFIWCGENMDFRVEDFTMEVKDFSYAITNFVTTLSSSKIYEYLKKDVFFVRGEVIRVKREQITPTFVKKIVEIKDSITNDTIVLNINNDAWYNELAQKIHEVLIFKVFITVNSRPLDGSITVYYNLNIIDFIGASKPETFYPDLSFIKNSLKKKNIFPDVYKIAVIHSLQKDVSGKSQTYLDFYHQIKEYEKFYSVYHTFPCAISQIDSVLEVINRINQGDYTILVILRGGTINGNDTSLNNVFNNKEILEALSLFRGYIIVGLGHSGHITLTDLIANISADTPTGAGIEFLKCIKENRYKKYQQYIVQNEKKFKYKAGLGGLIALGIGVLVGLLL